MCGGNKYIENIRTFPLNFSVELKMLQKRNLNSLRKKIVNIIFKNGRMKDYPLILIKRQECPLPLPLFNILLEVLASK